MFSMFSFHVLVCHLVTMKLGSHAFQDSTTLTKNGHGFNENLGRETSFLATTLNHPLPPPLNYKWWLFTKDSYSWQGRFSSIFGKIICCLRWSLMRSGHTGRLNSGRSRQIELWAIRAKLCVRFHSPFI